MSYFIFVGVLLVVVGYFAYRNKDKIQEILSKLRDPKDSGLGRDNGAGPSNLELGHLDSTLPTAKPPGVDPVRTPEAAPLDATDEYWRLFGLGRKPSDVIAQSPTPVASDTSYKDGNVLAFNNDGLFHRAVGMPGTIKQYDFVADRVALVRILGDRLPASIELGGFNRSRVWITFEDGTVVIPPEDHTGFWTTSVFDTKPGKYSVYILLVDGGATSVQLNFLTQVDAPVSTGR